MANPPVTPASNTLPSRLSGLLFGAGAVIGGYGLLRTWWLYHDLPPGVCPFDRYRPLTYVALGLLAASFVLDLLAALSARRKKESTQPEE